MIPAAPFCTASLAAMEKKKNWEREDGRRFGDP
jgi:hypothetical protein